MTFEEQFPTIKPDMACSKAHCEAEAYDGPLYHQSIIERTCIDRSRVREAIAHAYHVTQDDHIKDRIPSTRSVELHMRKIIEERLGL